MYKTKDTSGPFLAVVDGRFLPLDEFSIEGNVDKTSIRSTVARNNSITTQAEYTVSLKTYRDPQVRMNKLHRLWIFSQNKTWTIDEFSVGKCGAASMHDARHIVEGTGTEISVSER
jgi:hypothetical protein